MRRFCVAKIAPRNFIQQAPTHAVRELSHLCDLPFTNEDVLWYWKYVNMAESFHFKVFIIFFRYIVILSGMKTSFLRSIMELIRTENIRPFLTLKWMECSQIFLGPFITI